MKPVSDGIQVVAKAVSMIAVVVAVASLRATRDVTMPLGIAAFLVALVWPLQARLERRLPPRMAYPFTYLTILAIFGIFFYALILCAQAVANQIPKHEAQVKTRLVSVHEWLDQQGISGPKPDQMSEQVVSIFGSFVKILYESIGLVTLIAAFALLILLEVHAFRTRLEKRFSSAIAERFVHVVEDATRFIQRYMLTRTYTSGLTGILTGLFTWTVGLELAAVWGFIAFFLNYIPVLGSIVAVIPPSLLSMLSPHAYWLTPVTIIGLFLIQFIIGNYLDPMLQARFLSLSPLALIFSIPFWGWIWGIPGAFIAVPLTAVAVVACSHFQGTHWIADVLAETTVSPAAEEAQEQADVREDAASLEKPTESR